MSETAERKTISSEVSAQDRRKMIPALGLREYWYPAIQAKKVGKKSVIRSEILGDQVVFFRGQNGTIAALNAVCPHRGASLGRGDSHFAGTITCPYHGWTFDQQGKCVAVLTEGPDSFIPGKVSARKYETRILKGIVFIWMGTGSAAPIEEDVPEEFFEPDSESMVFWFAQEWDVNWAVALENSLDSHVPYVHRNSWLAITTTLRHYGPKGRRPIRVKNGVSAALTEATKRPPQEDYPGLGRWPKSKWRRWWTWILKPAIARAGKRSLFNRSDEWGQAHHLPNMFRTMSSTHAYTRNCVAIDASRTRVIYFYSTRPANLVHKIYIWAHYYLWFKWHMLVHFSNQDLHPMLEQRWDSPEMLSPNDAELIVWRKMLTSARGMDSSSLNSPEVTGEKFAHEGEREFGLPDTEKVQSIEFKT